MYLPSCIVTYHHRQALEGKQNESRDAISGAEFEDLSMSNDMVRSVPGRIRTRDPLLRRQPLYPTELQGLEGFRLKF